MALICFVLLYFLSSKNQLPLFRCKHANTLTFLKFSIMLVADRIVNVSAIFTLLNYVVI